MFGVSVFGSVRETCCYNSCIGSFGIIGPHGMICATKQICSRLITMWVPFFFFFFCCVWGMIDLDATWATGFLIPLLICVFIVVILGFTRVCWWFSFRVLRFWYGWKHRQVMLWDLVGWWNLFKLKNIKIIVRLFYCLKNFKL